RREEDLAATTVMDGSTLSAIDALPSCIAISKAPPRSGLSRSDFVRWHIAAAEDMSGYEAQRLFGEKRVSARFTDRRQLPLTLACLPGLALAARHFPLRKSSICLVGNSHSASAYSTI